MHLYDENDHVLIVFYTFRCTVGVNNSGDKCKKIAEMMFYFLLSSHIIYNMSYHRNWLTRQIAFCSKIIEVAQLCGLFLYK
jgi:hypothetical protein